MAEFSTPRSKEQTQHSVTHNDNPEDGPNHAPIPKPVQEDHLPMAFRPIYHFDTHKQDWIAQMPTASTLDASPLSAINLITWNIDFVQPYGEERYTAAVDFLEQFLTQRGKSDSPIGANNYITPSTIILLQEIDQRLLEYITGHRFVRECFIVTDISGDTWLNDDNVYGVVTLIPKVLSNNIASVFRTNFPGTRMGREAIYVDLLLLNTEELPLVSSPDSNATREQRQPSHQTLTCNYLRVANVHLESLRGRSDAERIEQLGSTVPFLAAPGVRVGVVAGDMNPIGPDDPGLPSSLGFVDAWVADVRQKKEREGCFITDQEIDDDALGHTWGYQPPTRFHPRRMDKVLIRGDVDVLEVEKIADKLEVRVNDDGETETLWVTDHCGLFARLRAL